MEGVDLIIQDYTAEELATQWTTLRQIMVAADESIRQAEREWQTTTEPDASARLWDHYSALWRDYQVLAAWTELFYSAYVFATSGFESVFLRDHPGGSPLITEHVSHPTRVPH